MDGEWLPAVCRIVPEVGMEACLTLRRTVIEKRRSGELAEADSVKVLDLLKARMEALKKGARQPVSGADVPPPQGEARSPAGRASRPDREELDNSSDVR